MTASFPGKLAKLALVNGKIRYDLFWSRVHKITVFSFAQVLLLGGCGAVAYGCWLWHHPVGWVVGGCFGIRLGSLAADDTLDK